MSIERRRFKRVLVAAAVLLLGIGCATNHKVNNSWPNDLKTNRAVVTTVAAVDPSKNQDRLKAYYQALQGLVGTTNLEEQFIGCQGCDRLSTANPPPDLKFIFFREHVKDMYAFTKAWEQVQASALSDKGFSVQIDAVDPAPPACVPPPACWPIPSCVSTGGCDKNKTLAGCQPC